MGLELQKLKNILPLATDIRRYVTAIVEIELTRPFFSGALFYWSALETCPGQKELIKDPILTGLCLMSNQSDSAVPALLTKCLLSNSTINTIPDDKYIIS